MPDEHDDDAEDLERPPAFFPLEHTDPLEGDPELGDPVEVVIEGVYYAESGPDMQRFVLLSNGDRRLPITIGGPEAMAILMPLEGEQPDRPLTHDLVRVLIERMGGTVDKIVIDDLWNGTYYAKLHLAFEGEVQEIDCRPSDAIALALRFEAPVFVLEGILKQSG